MVLDNVLKYENKDWLQNLVNSIKDSTVNKHVIIYGVTRCGRFTYDILKKHSINISIFCDDNPKLCNSKIDGIDIIPIKMLKNMFGLNSYIIVCSPTQSSVQKMISKCKDEGFKDVYYYPEFTIDCFNINLLETYKDEISELFDILEDDKSKEIVENILKIRLSGSYGEENILAPTIENEQYFPNDIINLSHAEVFLDAGAYNGDTIETFLNKVDNKFTKIYAFEIDEDNFCLLEQKISHLKELGVNTDDIEINKLGVFDSIKTLNYIGGLDQSSFVSDTGEYMMSVTTIDSYIANKIPPTFIKMDIEGSEVNALIGAKQTITSVKPDLAICIYHDPKHLWQIPIYLKTLVPQYKIYIRNHLLNLYDIVCYAVI